MKMSYNVQGSERIWNSQHGMSDDEGVTFLKRQLFVFLVNSDVPCSIFTAFLLCAGGLDLGHEHLLTRYCLIVSSLTETG